MPVATRRLQTSVGVNVALGRQLGAGGEGTVYAHASDNSLVVKIYNATMDPARQRKIRDMVAITATLSDDFKNVTAWPREIVMDGSQVVGFVMPRAEASEEIHVLYGPKSRKQFYPDAGFKFLVHVAMNIARSFHVVHREGMVIGDVNERLVMVSRAGVVRVLDCDSYQFNGPNGFHTCDVGVSWYAAPEIQDMSFRGLKRSVQHDLFSLAMMIFHILFLGRHPFAGRPHRLTEEMPLERAIRDCRFAYSADSGRTQMTPPPNTPSLTMPGQKIALFFERAFSPQAARAEVERPSAQEWADALLDLKKQLVTCNANAAHAYLPSANGCPFCQVDAATRFEAFHYVEPSGTPYVRVDVDAVWRAIGAIHWPIVVREPDASDFETAKKRAVLSADARALLQSNTDTKALADARDTLAFARGREMRAKDEVKTRTAELAEATAFLEAFDDDERRNSELGQLLTRSIRTKARWQTFCGVSALTSIGVAALYLLDPVLGMVLFALACGVTLWGSAAAIRVSSLVRQTETRKREIRDQLRGGLQLRVERKSKADRTLETAKAELVKIQGNVYASMTTVTALEEKARVEEERLKALHSEITARHQRINTRYEVWRRERKHLVEELNMAHGKFFDLKTEAERLVGERRRLDQRRKVERDTIAGQERENQLSSYLDQFFIAKVNWGRKIPKAVLATLPSYGIETAGDISWDAVQAVPGFGPTRTQALVDWKDRKKAGFSFNPSQVSTARLAAVDRHFVQACRDVDRKLTKTKDQIELLVKPLAGRNTTLANDIGSIVSEYGQMLLEEEKVFSKNSVPPMPVQRQALPPMTFQSPPAQAPRPPNWRSWTASKPKRRRKRRRP